MRLSTVLMRPLGTLLFILGFFPFLAHAASYVYDANGRLRAVTSSSGASSEYVYDALGNLYAVESVPASQLAIFAFTPNHGPVGTSVTIYGQGFSTTPASNIVKFNGVAATVSSPATATQLKVTVPASATTGTISVQVATATATSVDIFTVTSDAGGLPPTVASFTPAIADTTTSISVTGTNFVSTSGQTSAGVGVYTFAVTPTSSTHLNFTPSVGASGFVTVATPYGLAQSTTPLLVVPTSIGLSNVVSYANLTVGGSSQSINMATGGKYAAVTVPQTAGQWTTLQVDTLVATAIIGEYIVAPDGTLAPFYGAPNFGAASAQSIHLPQATTSGVYTVLFSAAPGNTFSFNVRAESDPLLTPTAVPISVTFSGQDKRVVLPGYPGEFLAINLPTFSTNPTGHQLYVSGTDILEMDRDTWGNFYGLVLSAPWASNFYQLTNSGGVTAQISTDAGVTLSAQVASLNNPNLPVIVGGSTVTATATVPNENAYFSYSETAGQNLSVGIALTTTPANGMVYIDLYDALGNELPGGQCAVPGCHFSLPIALGTGTAWIYIAPGTQAYTPVAKATVSVDLSGSLTAGVAKSIPLSRPGQVARYTFSNSAGTHVSLAMTNIATNPSGDTLHLSVTNPDGTFYPYSDAYMSSSDSLGLLLSQAGNYTVQIETENDDTSSSQVTLVEEPIAPITVNGSPVSQSTSAARERSYMTFAGTAGQHVTLALSSISSNPATPYIYAELIDPSGNVVGSYVSYAPPTGGANALPALTSTGTYTIEYFVLGPSTMAFTATLTSP